MHIKEAYLRRIEEEVLPLKLSKRPRKKNLTILKS